MNNINKFDTDQEYFLVLDFGSGAGRCFMVSTDGKKSFEEYQEWTYDYPQEAQPGGAEFLPQEFWVVLSKLIRKTIAKAGINPGQIVAISSTSQREGVVFLDKDGKELYGGPNLDMRAPSDAEAFNHEFAERIHAISGHWPFPMFLPYRLLWFKEHQPAVFNKISSVLLLNNWMLYRLCGQKATDPSNGVETAMVNIHTRDWAAELIDEMGFDKSILPPVFESGTVIGEVTLQAAEECGLRPGTPVVIGGADTQCAMLGTSVINSGDIGVVLGTYGPVQMVVPKPIIAAPELIWSGCHVVPERWVIESTTMETGQAFRWVRDVFYSSEATDTYAIMNREASESKSGGNGIRAYIGPRLPNYRKLEFAINGGFITQLPPTPGTAKRRDFARAALESVAFGVRMNVDRLKRVSGQDVDRLHISGGLSKSDLLMQIIAYTLNLPVSVPMNKEGSALGASICAGVGSQYYPTMTSAVDGLVHWETAFLPDHENFGSYNDLFELWKKDYVKMYGERTLVE